MLTLVTLSLICQVITPPAVSSSEQQDPRWAALRTLDTHSPFDAPGELADWQLRAERLRRRVLVAANLWPLPEQGSPEREAPAWGRGQWTERAGYRVAPLWIESMPGHHVTASLYVPDGSGPFPAVLCPHGHWTSGRFTVRTDEEVREELESEGEQYEANARYHLQARCAELARRGALVVHYDMIGYADAQALPHRGGFDDAEALLHGPNRLGLQTWNSIRVLDWVAAREDVDRERLGVTGGSGGGTQTFLLGAVDTRPAALVPAVMVSTGMQGGCICENAPYLRIGTGNVELAALAAPRPQLLLGADDWTLQVEQDGFPDLREVYALHAAAERAACIVHARFPHNYNAHSREPMFSWFHDWLGLEEPRPESRLEPLTPAELSVRELAGHAEARLLDQENLARRWRQRDRARLAKLWPGVEGGTAQRWREVTSGALRVMLDLDSPQLASCEDDADVQLESADLFARRFTRADGSFVRCVRGVPRGWDGERMVVLVSGRGRRVFGVGAGADESGGPADCSLSPSGIAARILGQGAAILIVEPLGTRPGEAGLDLPTDGGRHETHGAYTWCYNRPFLSEVARDVTLGLVHASAQARSVRLLGLDEAGPWVLLARALRADVDDCAAEWSSDLVSGLTLDDRRLLPGLGRLGGLDAAVALGCPQPIVLLSDDAGVREELGQARSRALYQASEVPAGWSVARRSGLEAVLERLASRPADAR